MSIRWMIVALAAFAVIDCGSDEGSNDGCEAGHKMKEVCTACGPVGGCMQKETKCAPTCSSGSVCARPLFCSDGVCQVAGCI